MKGLALLSKARCYRRDVSGVSLMFELEMQRLYAWAVEVGLGQQPPVLLVDMQYVVLVPRVLEHLQLRVSDLHRLKTNHGLQLQQATEQIRILEDGDASALDRLGVEPNDGFKKMLRRIFDGRKDPWLPIKWVMFEEQKARGLVGKINAFIQELEQILDRSRQAKLSKAVDMLLRSAVFNSASERDLDVIGSGRTQTLYDTGVAAAARFKKQGLLLGVMEAQESTSMPVASDSSLRPSSPASLPHSRSLQSLLPRYSNEDLAKMKLSARRLSFSAYTGREGRLLARYDDDPVLLEFRSEFGLDHDAMKDRLCKVSYFLRGLDESFHGIPCRGFVKVYDRYAYVLDLRDFLPRARDISAKPSYRTLRSLLDEIPSPSLNLRLEFATTLLETTLQLHTSGWLHKELRSENILFIAPSAQRSEDYLQAPMRIAGYVHARTDDPYEMTEPPASELLKDLYRHPACLRVPREPFQRAFDAFSVGCILLELGLWCSVEKLFQQMAKQSSHLGAQQAVDLMKVKHEVFSLGPKYRLLDRRRSDTSPLNESVSRRLAAAMGVAYASMVADYIYAYEDDAVASASPPPEDEERADPGAMRTDLLQMEVDSLEKLRGIAEVL